ncbi:MAG: hypothetical protein IJP96_00610 [Synergistaceae bacterium]|nr:hypothetical protein [Synergistaceae bacterium]MBQ6434576.1 hypothetical protein [Synergistaceae bacterium]MBR0074240.1 hypothetical protein [Synergistaceae bacterium]MBR0254268.1 hypothetical protein [Synergistaceae bacterium]MBR0315508.1 hypothetical protein [Synergistaceae bacterium]
MTKRKAETIVEVVTAMAIFGMIMAGVSDFIAGQTKNVADILDRDAIMSHAPIILDYHIKNPTINSYSYNNVKSNVSRDSSEKIKAMTLTKGTATMEFKF